MSMKFRRGLDTNLSGVVAAAGEPLWTTDTSGFFIGDGVTSGGIFVGPSLADSGLYRAGRYLGIDYTTTDVRYQLSGTGSASSGSWEISGTSAAALLTLPALYQASGSYQPSGNYQLSGLYQPSGNYALSGTGGGSSTFLGLSDVSGTFASGNIARYNGTYFVPYTPALITTSATIEAADILLNETNSAVSGTLFSVSGIAASGYDYIQIDMYGRSTVNATDEAILMSFNGDTTDANYHSARSLGGNGVFNAVGDTRQIGIIEGQQNAGTSFTANRLVISNPSSTTTHKSSFGQVADRQSATIQYTAVLAHRWENDAAVNYILLTPITAFASGTRCLITGYKSRTFITSVSLT